jgi:hypothetical protein
MQIQSCATTKEKPFEKSEELFTTLTTQLQSDPVLRLTHSELERLLETESRKLFCQLLQEHLDYRGPGEAMGKVMGNGGVERTSARPRERSLKTIFGGVKVSRLGYSAHGEESMFPRDAELNLPPELYSHQVQRRAADEVIKGSFDQAACAILSTTGTSVPKRQLEQLASRSAVDFDSFYTGRGSNAAREAEQTGPILVLSTDGKGIVMREKDLREATRKAAATGKHKMSKRLSRGEKDNRKRMAQVATVFTIAAFMRAPEDVVEDYRSLQDAGEKKVRPKPEHKRVWASVAKEPDEVIEDMFEEALRRDPSMAKQWVALVDGNAKQISLIRQTAKKLGLGITIVMDVIHVLEYLWSAGIALHGEGNSGTQRWVSQRFLEILRGHSSDVAAGMRRSATLRNMSAGKRKAIDACARYLLNHREFLRYDQYLMDGFPIASGVIEGACRYLVKDRMDITGACWGLESAEAVLKLRALRSSGDLDEYWSFHEKAEQVRNHLDLYQGAPPPTRLPLKARSPYFLRLVN